MHRRKVWMCLWTCLFLLSTSLTAFAQDETTGRAVTQDDWVQRLPIFVLAIMIVIAVDLVFILPIFRKRRSEDAQNTEGEGH